MRSWFFFIIGVVALCQLSDMNPFLLWETYRDFLNEYVTDFTTYRLYYFTALLATVISFGVVTWDT